MRSSITVTHSIYGEFDPERLSLTIDSIRGQDHPNIEVIVSEENETPRFRMEASRLGATYVFSEKRPDHEHNPGAIRNRALRAVRSELVYMNDSDIIFLDPTYLSRLEALHEQGETPLAKPPVVRLHEESFDEFSKRAQEDGIRSALETLVELNRYQVATEWTDSTLAIIGRRGRTFTVDHSKFIQYLQDPSLRGTEPSFWYDVVHPGGTFASVKQLLYVGGYSETYRVWGFEDSDLQWKLDQRFGCRPIPHDQQFNVLHLDHQKGYFDKSQNQQNHRVFEERKSRGIEEAIEHDRSTFLQVESHEY